LIASTLIRSAETDADFAAFAGLIDEYLAWFRVRYRHDPWFADRVFSHQGLAEELRTLPATYGPPGGRTLLAVADGGICGAGAYRRLADGSCEMKRLFVPERCRGRGIGRQLGAALIAAARADGYRVMHLDSASLLTEAIALYRGLGFRDCAPYQDYPAPFLPYLVFMERPLDA